MMKQRMRRAVGIATVAVVLALTAVPAPVAHADDYEADRAGHPYRVVAYLLHPVGVALDYLIFRPAHWVGSHEPFRTLFGHEAD